MSGGLVDLQDVDDRYRIGLTFRGLWCARAYGTGAHDFVPSIGALGFTSRQALRRVVDKADRHSYSTRTIRMRSRR